MAPLLRGPGAEEDGAQSFLGAIAEMCIRDRPKAPAGGASFSEALCTGLLQGCFLWGADLVGSASSGVTADDVGRLAWLVVTDGSPNLTATFWERVEDRCV